MKLFFPLLLFAFLFFSFLLGKDSTSQAPQVLLTPNIDGIKGEKQPTISLEKSQQFKPVLDPPWVSMYIPVRSCHRKLRKKYGEFSPPKYLNGFEGNIWCNWTVWAGSRKHIIIYIEGFKSDEGCDKNEDKIFFHGVSSLAENMEVYACWGKEMHTFATYAKGVNVVFLMRHHINPRKEGFVGKYYIFKHQENRLLPKDAIDSEMPAPEPSPGVRNSILQSNKEPLLLILENASSIISSNHRTNKAVELNESLQASRKKGSVVSLMGFIRKTENLSMPFTFSNGSEKPSVIWRMSTDETPVGLSDSTTTPHLSSSDIPYFEVAPAKESYSSLEGTESPSRILISALGFFVEDHLWMSSKSTQVTPVTSYQEQSSVCISLASKMLSGSGNMGFKLQSSHLVDLATQHRLSPSPSITTTAHLITAEPGFSYVATFSMTADTLSFPDQDTEPLPFHSTRAAHLLAVSDPEVILSDQEYILSPSMRQAHPFSSAGSCQSLSVCAELQTPTLTEQESRIFSITPPDISSSVKEQRCSYAEEGMILQADTHLETICPTAALLEPRASENAVVATKTLSAAFLVNEFVPSFGLQTAKDIEIPLSRNLDLDVVYTPKQKSYLVTMVSSSLSVHKMIAPCSSHYADLECLFLAAVQPSIIQPLLGGKEDNELGTESGEKDKKMLPVNMLKPLNLVSKPELCSSLDRFTVSTLSPLHESFTDLPLICVPIINAEKQPGNTTENAFISSTAVVPLLSCNEMQTPAMLSPMPLEVVREERGQTREPLKSWEMQHHAKWQQPSLEFIVADLDVLGTLLVDPSLREGLDLSTMQASKVGLLLNYRESEFPWLLVYFPLKSCHVILKDEAGTFSPPTLSRMQTNNWCNWTIWAGSHKHILVYIDGFEGRSDCEKNQDKIIFQGVSSSVESKVAYACRNHGTLIFATQAVAVHVVFLSTFSSENHIHKQFKGRYYIFEDYEASSTGGKDPLLKSNSNFGLSSKSYVQHSGHILDFVKTRRKLSNENWLPVTNKEKREENESAAHLEAFLKPALGNHMQVSVLKSMVNVTVHPLASSIHDTRNENEISSDNLKKFLDIRSNILKNEEKSTYNPVFPSNSPHVPQEVKMKKKVKMKDNGITIESAYHQNTATHWMPLYMSGSGRAVSGTSAFKKAIAFPQVSKEKQIIPVPSPKSIPRTTQVLILQSQQSNSGFSRKITDVIQSQPLLELKEALNFKGEKMDNEIYRADSSNSGQSIIVDAAGKNESQRPELFVTEMPPNSTAKTLDHLGMLLAPSVGALNHNFMDAATTFSPHIVLSGNLKSTEGETAAITHSSNSETRYKENPQRKHMKPNPPYPPSGWKLRNSPSLKEENNSYEKNFVFRTHEDHSALESKHHPGDLLFEITFGIEHKGQLPPIRSDVEKALIESIKRKVQEKVKLFSDKIKEVKLKEVVRRDKTEMDRQNNPNLIFTFWLHLTSEEKNMSHLVHSQLEDLSGVSMGVGEVRTILVRDVNECSAGIGLCGVEAICLNGFGTYLCQCKEEYEDHSLTKSGTLCLRGPRSDIGSLYSYTEILVGTTVFLISVLVVVISVLCAIVKKKRTKKNVHFQEAALPGTPATSQLQQTAFDQNNIRHLLTLDPAQLKLRAKVPEWPLQARTSPSETYRVAIEQSECL